MNLKGGEKFTPYSRSPDKQISFSRLKPDSRVSANSRDDALPRPDLEVQRESSRRADFGGTSRGGAIATQRLPLTNYLEILPVTPPGQRVLRKLKEMKFTDEFVFAPPNTSLPLSKNTMTRHMILDHLQPPEVRWL
ncbi:hypothetical protein EVAR_89250_1 [Eumeta japonica]|uniref:Uncharacterized protein n=1 Tax=Eumeta variegata TaxID=151549 RepID=A0A4C1VIU6_EUMVA|nr:hypothetical protein EVAR_89250_1 [Eumeta japonica]